MLSLSAAVWLWSPLLRAESNPAAELIEARDFAVLGEQAGDSQLPIVLAFVAEDCGYCRLLESEFLRPMMVSGDYEGRRVLLRTLHIDTYEQLTDFAGQTQSAGSFATQYKVYVTPTVLFLDGQGRELAQRMLGINTVDFYGAYLDRNIDKSLKRLLNASAPDASASAAGFEISSAAAGLGGTSLRRVGH